MVDWCGGGLDQYGDLVQFLPMSDCPVALNTNKGTKRIKK